MNRAIKHNCTYRLGVICNQTFDSTWLGVDGTRDRISNVVDEMLNDPSNERLVAAVLTHEHQVIPHSRPPKRLLQNKTSFISQKPRGKRRLVFLVHVLVVCCGGLLTSLVGLLPDSVCRCPRAR